MEKIGDWFKDRFVYCGITEKEFSEIQHAVQKKNKEMLSKASIISGILLGCLFLISFGSPTIAKMQTLYGAAAICMLLLFILSNTLVSRYLNLATVGCYVLMIFAFGFAIILGTSIQTEIPATTFCVLLFAAPLLFIDKPYRMFLFLLTATAIFCYYSFHIKIYETANMDEINAVSFLFLGSLVNSDVTRTKMRDLAQHRYIEHAKDTDSLTELMTKAAAEREIKTYMRITDDAAALLVLDIDDFKMVNDTYGHAFGDSVIRLMGQCIRQIFRDSDILGRFGGDEFVIFLPHMKDKESLNKRIEKFKALVKTQMILPGNTGRLQGSIGVALYPEDGSTYKDLFQHADEALYIAKKQGKNAHVFYHSQPRN